MTQSKVPIIVLGVLIAALALIILPSTANFQQQTSTQTVYTVQVGGTVPVPDGFTFTLTGLTPTAATFTIKKNGQTLATDSLFALGQPRNVFGLGVTYVSFTAPSARIEVVTTAPRVNRAAALSIFAQKTFGRYPESSLKVTEAACPAPDQDSLCWVVSGFKKETNAAGIVQTETSAVAIDHYEFVDTSVIYVQQSSGKVEKFYKST